MIKIISLAAIMSMALNVTPLFADPLQKPLVASPQGQGVFRDNVLRLPFVSVSGTDESINYYQVNLRAMNQAEGLYFKLDNATPVAAPEDTNTPSFDPQRGILQLPRVDVSGSVFMAALKQVGDTLDFSLEEAVPDIAKSARLRAAMTQLDKNFIGVLFTTNTNAANAPTITTAITLLNTLQNTWRGFKRDYAGVGGAEWTSYFSLLDQDLETAKTILTQAQSIADNEPQNLMVAHEAMENFRNLLSQLRAENQVDYAMDTVTRLHHAMEPLVGSIVNVSTPAEMSPDVISALLTHFPPFLDELNQLAQRDINAIAQQYHFSEQKKQILIQALSGQQNNMQAITKAYQNNDMTAVLQGIQKIKPLFVKLFLTFGDFITPFNAQMAAMEKAYVPALFMSNNPAVPAADMPKLLDAVANFSTSWNDFSQHFNPALQNILVWNETLSQVDNSLNAANNVLQNINSYPANLVPAHEALEGVRQALMNWRKLENRDYVMDNVTAYHNLMEPIALFVMTAASNGGLNSDDMPPLTNMVNSAQIALKKMATSIANMPLADFAFDNNKHGQLQQAVQNQTDNINALQTAIAAADTDAVMAAGQKVKPLFVYLFKQIGNIN